MRNTTELMARGTTRPRSGLFAEEFARIGDERSGRRAVQHKLAQCAQDEENEQTAHGVDDEQAGTRGMQPPAPMNRPVPIAPPMAII
jgi:hypothetical protein